MKIKILQIILAELLLFCVSYSHASCRCEQITTYVNGRRVCSCKPGYVVSSNNVKKCQDVDECSETNQPICEHNCTNTIGSYTCSCKAGYNISSTDSNKCEDIDECKNPSTRPCEQICTNTNGSYTCSCYPGYIVKTTGLKMCERPCVAYSNFYDLTRATSTHKKCFTGCTANRFCLGYEYRVGGVCIQRILSGVKNTSEEVSSDPMIICFNQTAQSQCKSISENYDDVQVTVTSQQDCFTTCTEHPKCWGYTYNAISKSCEYQVMSGVEIDTNADISTSSYILC